MWSAVRKRSFRKAEYEESSRRLNNPGCGWYHIHTFAAQKAPALPAEIEPEEELALVLIDIGAFRAEELSETALSHIRQIFDFFHEKGRQMILRFAYDTAGKGPEREPGALSLVRRHMEQAGSVICDYTEDILVIQGIFVGSWGEMHGSKFLGREQMRELAAGLWRTTGESCCLAVRTPAQWREIAADAGGEAVPGKRLALFNDGMFGSVTDLGTYGGTDEREQEAERARELEWQSGHMESVPCGGEALWSGTPTGYMAAAQDMKRMHVSYLNSAYHPRLLSYWRQERVREPGCWQGMSGYDYIGGHLGYRFVVQAVSPARGNALNVLIENCGFAGLCVEAECLLVTEDESGRVSRAVLDTDPREWKSGKRTLLRIGLPGPRGMPADEKTGRIAGRSAEKKAHKLFLELRRKGDGRILRFANRGADERVLLGEIS